MAGRRMHDQPGRFVDHDQIVVLKDGKRQILRRCRGAGGGMSTVTNWSGAREGRLGHDSPPRRPGLRRSDEPKKRLRP